MQRCALFLCALVATTALFMESFSSVADAQQLKPYFLVIADTSGSMGWCKGGTQSNPNADCSCHTGNNCSNGFINNRCGFPSNKIGDAKCALQRIVDSTGDATFGLMHFEHPCDANCNATSGSCGMSCTNGGTSCDDAQLAVAIETSNASRMREWVDGVCGSQGACGGTDYKHELTLGQWTPIAKSLERANEYLRSGLQTAQNVSGRSASSPISNDPQLACRPVSVILLTDGDDTCSGNPTSEPVTRAQTLNTGSLTASTAAQKAFRTYVIGFGASGGNFNPTVLDNIAMAGGTDAPGGTRYFPASDEATLSVALNQIIADAQPPQEICNSADDDCDMKIDEGIMKYCDLPNGQSNKVLCDEPKETNCDGIDDDCDGVIDEELTNACGTCGDLPKELCDGVDNDCDQRIDEDASSGEACGSDEGECEKGMIVCVDGMEKCEGAIGPMDEICDCKDNDCDGQIDEEGGTDPLCPGEQRCAGCKCVPFCKPAQEFGNICPIGLAPSVQKDSGECVCVADNCESRSCALQTKQTNSDLQCAPKSDVVGSCVCQAGECVGRCTGVTCPGGQACNPKNGECIENNCRGRGCPSGEICEPMGATCVADKCKDVKCEADELCRGGTCEKSCATIRCSPGEQCTRGECATDKCANKTCGNGEACNPNTGECVINRCEAQVCPKGQSCSILTNTCGADPCWDVKCPSGQQCSRGECEMRSMDNGDDGAGGEGPEAPRKRTRLFAGGGGGGCACSVPGPTGPSSRDLGPLLLCLGFGAFVAVRVRRRRARRGAVSSLRGLFGLLGIAVLLASPLMAACKVTPLCLDAKCGDAGSGKPSDSGTPDTGIVNPTPIDDGSVDSGERDATVDSGDDGPGMTDGGLPMCKATGPETCNGKDDDCDFKADEGVAATQNNCLQRGVCAGTAPSCAGGKFVCRYNNDYETEESRCDGKDNDCDGNVDESFTQLGSACEQGIGACKVTGTRKCNGAGTGLTCELPAPPEPGEEVCNGIDDDCDGMIDEPKGNPGTNESYVHDDMVKIGGSLWVYKYEASRADAKADNSGILTTRACSKANVLPWTNLTFTQAKAACEASGLSLCSVDNWKTACKGQSGTCTWAYTSGSSCPAYPSNGANACNGHDVNAQPGSADNDALKPSGSLANCFADFGGAGKVFDLSGNAKEWTSDTTSPGQNPLRGGSYNNSPMGLQCDFDFSVAAADIHLPNVGFRCCTSTAP